MGNQSVFVGRDKHVPPFAVGAIHELPLPFNARNADVISTYLQSKRTRRAGPSESKPDKCVLPKIRGPG